MFQHLKLGSLNRDDSEAIINSNSSFSSKTECPRSWLNMKIYCCNPVWIRELEHTDMGACYQTYEEQAIKHVQVD